MELILPQGNKQWNTYCSWSVVYLVNVPTLRSCEMYNEVSDWSRGKKLRVEVQRVWTIDVCICFLLQTPPNTKCLKREKEGYEFNIAYKMEQKFLTDITLIINGIRTEKLNIGSTRKSYLWISNENPIHKISLIQNK